MKSFYLIVLFLGSFSALAQEEYFVAKNKEQGLAYYKNLLYEGCTKLKPKQEPVSHAEMKKLVEGAISIVTRNFSQAFRENPKIKTAFEKDMKELMANTNCQLEANDCRAKVLGLSMFYYHRMRADIPECRDYKKDGGDQQCETEIKFRKSSFQGIREGTYNLTPVTHYRNALVKLKNDTTFDLVKLTIQKDANSFHICNSPEAPGPVHQFKLEIDEPGKYFADVDPEYDIRKKISKNCVEEKVKLHGEFYSSNFDKDRDTVGQDQIGPVKVKVLDYVKSHPEEIVTDVLIFSTSSKTPYYTTINGKRVIDPKSNERNLILAQQRASFAKTVFKGVRNSDLQFKNIRFIIKASLAGPNFHPMDLNDRFVTPMTPGYYQKLEALYRRHKIRYEKESLKTSAQDLINEKEYVNLYQAKFKPFHGFRIIIYGHKKEDLKCLETLPESDWNPGASKQ